MFDDNNMTTLVAMLTEGGWNHVSKLIEGEEWQKVILVTTRSCMEKFNCTKTHESIIIDIEWPVQEIINAIKKGLEKEYGEVGLNFVSGTGKEHMALLAGVMQAGLSFRLVAVTKEGISEL